MLFHAPIFLFVFLPLTFLLFLAADRWSAGTLRWLLLIIASFIFYSYFRWGYFFLLAASMAANYAFSFAIIMARYAKRAKFAGFLLASAITTDLSLLGIFKYSDFIVDNINVIFSGSLTPPHLLLPLAISFFTFQQIAYLVDVYREPSRKVSIMEYVFFTVFFPHLIAGPICYSSDIVPQMHRQRSADEIWQDAQAGLIAFVIGLFKKVVIASYFQAVADAGFGANSQVDAATAMIAVIAYSLQIYFDFSAYSDMAIGLGLLFGIRLPLNFYSPYKASSIIEFWRCWHITLSRFLRDYLYIPLGGSRYGRRQTAANLMIVMVIAGLWHGAGWTFALWGAIHGAMLIANHAWRALRKHSSASPATALAKQWGARVLTFLLVSLAWIPFRATDLEATRKIYVALLTVPASLPQEFGWTMLAICVGLAICWCLPNTAQLLVNFNPVCTAPPTDATFGRSRLSTMRAGLNPAWAFVTALFIFAVVRGSLDRGADVFIYFQF
jgi:D-alanyl-lipoteichoic acid acyltransferase DltB (MBOAT superfamily)